MDKNEFVKKINSGNKLFILKNLIHTEKSGWTCSASVSCVGRIVRFLNWHDTIHSAINVQSIHTHECFYVNYEDLVFDYIKSKKKKSYTFNCENLFIT